MTVKWKDLSLIVMTAVFLGGFFLWAVVKPADAESVSERRKLAAFPAVRKEAVFSGSFMKDFENYALDQFPLRDQFRTVKAAAALGVLGKKDNNGIYIKDGFAAKLEYPLDTASVAYAAARFRFLYETYLADQDMRIFLSVIPDKNYFMAEKNGYPAMDYETLRSELREKLDFAAYIEIADTLELSDYYRTDLHWRQEKIEDTARRLADGMDVSLSAEYTMHQAEEPFYGIYYGQSALSLQPDTLVYLESAYLKNCKVYDFETNAEIPMYDLEKTKGSDPYEMFLQGSKSLLTIENPHAGTEKELILFRDSFGSSIAPLLAEGYKKITLADIRYISPEMLGRFVTFTDQDVLFLYSVPVLNHSITIK